VYGWTALTLQIYDIATVAERSKVDLELIDKDETLRRLKEHLIAAQNRIKQVYDRGHREREFVVDDLVYVREQPYR
jgi:hypothetical protein